MDVVTKCYIDDQIRAYCNQFNEKNSVNFSENMYKNLLRVNDRVQCISRYRWYNLPNGFDGTDIETLLYDNGSICVFSENDNIIFSPFTTTGTLDIKGNLNKIQPVLLDGTTKPPLKRCYNSKAQFSFDENCCIIIQDYTGCIQQNQENNIISRRLLNETTTIHDEVKTYKILLYNIMLSIKKMLVTCEGEEQSKVALKQAETLLDPTQPIVAMSLGNNYMSKFDVTQFVDKVEVDDLTRAIDFYDKTRRLNNGVPSPDTFEKKERMITEEIKNAGTYSNLILSDGLINRQKAVSYINECFNLNISVEINENLEV